MAAPSPPAFTSPLSTLPVIFINLARRTDRREAIEAELARVGFAPGQVFRFAALEHPASPNAGCNLSHAAALRWAHAELGAEVALILEDDFQFAGGAEQVQAAIAAVLEAGEAEGEAASWDAVLLTASYAVLEREGEANPPWKRCLSASNAAGYLVRRREMLPLAELIHEAAEPLARTGEHWNYQNDVVWRARMRRGRWLAFEPRLGFQRPGYSDLARRVVDNR